MDALNRLTALLGGLAASATLAGGAPPAQATTPPGQGDHRERNKALLRWAFGQQNSGGSVYEVLADDVVWSVVNGRTYQGKHQFLAEGAAPVLDRLDTPLLMRILEMWAERDTVVVRFEADATALDGVAYHNEYCWIMVLRGSRVVRVNAFLDMVAVGDLIERVQLPDRPVVS
ncbi:nuclear transport factor 2 family protein [Streptomyces sp. NPDC058653]|uniref:nuclear transport factor 2 family protein n=1 Tax=Streptomyces sp. NPDC058653 TaxID=3346576 RepID=UPI003666C48E